MDERTQLYIATVQTQWAEQLKMANDQAAQAATNAYYLRQEKEGLMKENEEKQKEIDKLKKELASLKPSKTSEQQKPNKER